MCFLFFGCEMSFRRLCLRLNGLALGSVSSVSVFYDDELVLRDDIVL